MRVANSAAPFRTRSGLQEEPRRAGPGAGARRAAREAHHQRGQSEDRGPAQAAGGGDLREDGAGRQARDGEGGWRRRRRRQVGSGADGKDEERPDTGGAAAASDAR